MSETIEVELIRRLNIKADETLVITLPERLSMQDMDDARKRVEAHLPAGVKVLFTTPGVEMAVVAADDNT